jgi:hypothetical protein
MRFLLIPLLLAFTEFSSISMTYALGAIQVANVTITQGLQDAANTVPMIAGKRTFVQVFLDYNDQGPASGVTGTLEIRRPGSGVVVPIANVTAVMTTLDPALNGNPDRRKLIDRSLVFEVPALWIGPGTISLQLATVKLATGEQITCSNCAASKLAVTFHRAAALRLVLIGMRYARAGRLLEPRAEDYQAIVSWIMRTYPVAQIETEIRVIDWDAAPTAFNDSACTLLNLLLLDLRKQDQSDSNYRLQHYYGVVPDGWSPGVLTRSFMRGCAFVPTTVSEIDHAIGSGPSGIPSDDLFQWDKSASYAGWYAAHEIAHTLGRQHVGGCGNEPPPLDAAWPPNFAGGKIGTVQTPYVGFDPGDGLNVPMRVISWDVGTDAMTYCPNQWISYHTFSALCERINAENGSACPTVAASQVVVGGASSNNLGQGPGPSPGTAPTLPSQAELPGPGGTNPPVTGAAAPNPAALNSAPPSLSPTQGAPPPAPQIGPYLSVTGQLNLETNTGTISASRLDRPIRPSSPPGLQKPDTPLIRIYDAGGKLLAESAATVLLNSDAPAGAPPIALISGEVPYSPDIWRIEVVRNGSVVARQVASGTSPSISQPSVEMPTLKGLLPGNDFSAIKSASKTGFLVEHSAVITGFGLGLPPPGVSVTQERGKLMYNWSNPNPTVPLSYTVQLSTDNGRQWRTVAVKSSRTSIEIDPTWLGDASTIQLRVKASDGIHESIATSAPLSLNVPLRAPAQ